jgi:hypothetical protein
LDFISIKFAGKIKRKVMSKQFVITILFIILFEVSSFGQAKNDSLNKIRVPAIIENGDTLILGYLDDINIYSKPVFQSRGDERRYWRLVYNLKKVYPYAKLAGIKLKEMNEHFLTLKNEKEKKDYTKQVEDDIRRQFEADLKDLNTTQGLLLIKLIDRETGKTSYSLVKELRGGLSAVFWQTLARIFGYNLKTKYDPLGDDKLIEQLVVAIDQGLI